MRWFLLSWCCLVGWVVAADRPMDHPHPRLLFPASAEKKLQDTIATDPLAAQLQQNNLLRADAVIKSRTCRFEKSDGKRLLPESRLALHNILHTAWAWRTSRDKKYFDRTLAEMDAACTMPSWNPDHFLDTAEMATAMAIGYDWLYPELSAQQRKKYADALHGKGLLALVNRKHAWWKSATNNWSQVCGTGMGFAAIALDELQPERCAEVLLESQQLLEKCVRFYLPDGAYPEGPGYWHYGSNYQILHFAAQQSLFGKTEVNEIWKRSAEFMIHMNAPGGGTFNFADGGMREFYPTPAQTWIAAQFPQSALPEWSRESLGLLLKNRAWEVKTSDTRFHPLHLLWLPPVPKKSPSLELSARFGGEQELAFARTSWDATAAWLAIKGGTGAANHGHLDAGSFVYEAGGVRWFVDLGKEEYNLPGYFGKQRWQYFRLNNRSHNTLVIGDALQEAPMPGCPVTPWKKEVDEILHAEIDLTKAYSKQCVKAKRAVFFHCANGAVTLEDRIEKPMGDVRWAVVTDARISILGRTVTLQKNGKTLLLQREDITGGEWQEFSLIPPTEQENRNKGFRMIGFRVPASDQVKVRVSWKLSTNEKER
jgi:hypothetical protein